MQETLVGNAEDNKKAIVDFFREGNTLVEKEDNWTQTARALV